MNEAFGQYLQVFQVMAMGGPTMLGTLGSMAAVPTLMGNAADAMVQAYGFASLANQVPEPPKVVDSRAGLNLDGTAYVEIHFRRSASHDANSNFVYALYRYQSPSAPRETVAVVPVPASVTAALTPTRFNEAYLDFFVRDSDPLPTVTDPFGNLVKAPSATWYYALTATRLQEGWLAIDPYAFETAVPWWTLAGRGQVDGLLPVITRSRQMMVSDYSAPVVVTATASGLPVRTDNIAVDRASGDVYYLDTSGDPQSTTINRPRILKVEEQGKGQRSIFGFTDFKVPGPKGLTIDRNSALYSDNSASDAQFGGRIFQFAQPDALRAFVGSINYFSMDLQFANPTSAGPMDMGPGAVPSSSREDDYVVDAMERMVKRTPVQAPYDPYRRVGQPWASIPFVTTSVDLVMEQATGNGDLLVDRIAAAGLTAQLTISDFYRQPGETLTVEMLVTNPGLQTVNNVSAGTLKQEGGGLFFLTQTPNPAAVTLLPGGQASFKFTCVAGRGGFVTFKGVASGTLPSSDVISSLEAASAQVEIGSPLVVNSITADPDSVSPGGSFKLTVELYNRGSTQITSISAHLTPVFPDASLVPQLVPLDGPTPTVLDLAPKATRQVIYHYQGNTAGVVVFEAVANGIDAVSGDPVASVPTQSAPVTISPMRVTIRTEPAGIGMGETFNIAVNVKNLATGALVNVQTSLADISNFGLKQGAITITGQPSPLMVHLNPGEDHDFLYPAKAAQQGLVEVQATATASTGAGPIKASARKKFSIGPAIFGRVTDVLLDLPTTLTLGLGTVIDDKIHGLQNLTVLAIDAQGNQLSDVTDRDGAYAIPTKTPGTYTVQVVDAVTSIGFQARIEVGASAVQQDIALPLSLYKRSQQLVVELQTMPYRMIDPEFFTHMGQILPPFDKTPTLNFAYGYARTPLEKFLQKIPRGLNTTPYKGAYRGRGRRPDEWDALQRLALMMAFTRRRFEDIKVLGYLTVRGFLLPIMTCEFANKKVLGSIDNFNVFTFFKKRVGLIRPGQAIPPVDPFVKQAQMQKRIEKVTGIMIAVVIDQVVKRVSGPIKDDDLRRMRDNTTTLVFKMIRFGFAIFSGQLKGDLVFEVVFQLAMVYGTQFFLNTYINELTQPALIEAVNRANALDVRGDTLDVLSVISSFDAQIVTAMQAQQDTLTKLHLGLAMVRGLNGLNDLRIGRTVATMSDAEKMEYFKNEGKAAQSLVSLLKRVTALGFVIPSTLVAGEVMIVHPGAVAGALETITTDERFYVDDIYAQILAQFDLRADPRLFPPSPGIPPIPELPLSTTIFF